MAQTLHSLLATTTGTLPDETGAADAIVCSASMAARLGLARSTFLLMPDESEATLRSLVRLAPAGIVLENCRTGAGVQRLDVLLSVAEAEEGVSAGQTCILAWTDGLLPPPASEFGFKGKSRRLAGLVWDWRSLAKTLGASRWREPDGRWTDAFSSARTATLVAAKTAGIAAYDVVADQPGEDFSSECRNARADGFDGRVTDDIGRIAAINAAFKAAG